MKIFGRCMKIGTVPEDWKLACVIPVHKGRRGLKDWESYRGIIILNGNAINGKLEQEEEKKGLRSSKGCIHQPYVLKQVVEKYTEEEGDLCGIHEFGKGM